MAMTGGRNDDTYTRVSGRERGGEIPMRLKLTAAGWIPDRESEKGSAAVCEGREEYRNNNIREFYISKLYEAAGTESVPAVEDHFIENRYQASLATVFCGMISITKRSSYLRNPLFLLRFDRKCVIIKADNGKEGLRNAFS